MTWTRRWRSWQADRLHGAQGPGEHPGVGLVRHPAEGGDRHEVLGGDVLALGVLQQALTAVPAPQPGRLHAAHRGGDAAPGRGVALVDVDPAGLDAGRDLAPTA